MVKMTVRVQGVLLGLAVLAVLGTLWSPWQRSRDRGLVTMVAQLDGQWVGRPAPPFDLEGLDGRRHTLTDHQGKVIFLNVWASFCEPCREEMPSMERLVRTYSERGLVMLAVSVDPEVSEAKGFMEAFLPGQQSGMTVLHDPHAAMAAAYGTELLPETYLIDRDGRIIARFVNAYDWTRPEVKQLIERLLSDEGGLGSRPLL